MKVKSCEKAEKSRMVLTVEVEADEFDAAVEKAYRKTRRKIRVPGFRPGKAPRKIMEAMFGPEVFYEEAINAAFPDAYDAAVKEKELRTVGMPEVELEGKPSRSGFTFKATVPVYPEVTLGQYKGLSAPRRTVSVTDADVEARIGQLADRNTRLVSVDREAREGDTVVIDYEGFLDGVPFAGGKGENHSLELGSHSFVPGFEEQLVGAKAEEERSINVTFPDNYAKDLAGKEAAFQVKVREVKEKDVPELDDEFAKDVSEFDTLAELRENLRVSIEKEREEAARREFEDALMEKAADNITADIPDILVENQAKRFVNNLKNQVFQQGMSYEQYLQISGLQEEKILQDAMEPALRQVRMDLTVAAIIDAEHIEASEEEIEAEYAKLAEQSGMDTESIKKYFNQDQIREQVLTRKAVSLVADSAAAEEMPEEKPAQDEAENAAE